MVAGAQGLDLVMLIVAADDGVMPQTSDVAVCEFLGLQRGLIVMTKADLVDDEMRALVEEDIRLSVAGTFLEDAPLIATRRSRV